MAVMLQLVYYLFVAAEVFHLVGDILLFGAKLLHWITVQLLPL